jgi:RNA polymerase sigma-70 factor (ECF subfamily)
MDVTKPGTLVEARPAERASAEDPEVTALIERAQGGDADAFGDLMRLYERRVIALGIQMGLSREDALDACQDTFVNVFRYIKRFRSGRSFFKWLYRISVHAVYDHLRHTRQPGVVSLDDAGMTLADRLLDQGPSSYRQAESADLARKLLASLDLLTRQERIVFVLRDLQQMATEDIGRVLRLSQVTVRRHCMSARQKLRDRLLPRNY